MQWLADSVLAVDPLVDEADARDKMGQFAIYEDLYIEQLVRLMEKYEKPILGVYLLADEKTRLVMDVEGSPFKGVNYPTPEREKGPGQDVLIWAVACQRRRSGFVKQATKTALARHDHM